MSNPASPRRRSPVPVDQCGAALAADILSDRWAFLIIREAFYGVKRYDDIREDIQIPRSVLTARLKRLVEQGILARAPYREEGARTRYAYVLTDKGKDLGLIILAMMQWGDAHLKNGVAAIDVSDRKTGAPLQVALITQHTAHTPLSQVRITPRTPTPVKSGPSD